MKASATAKMPSRTIREIQPADIPAVSNLAERIWRQHYLDIISHEQIEYMLELMYSPSSLKEQIQKDHRFWLLYDGSDLAGYVSVEKRGDGQWFIQKLYVDQSTPRQGLGSALLQYITEHLKPRQLSLVVNRKNYKAINFYFKHGFVIERPVVTDIGDGFVMDDFLMQKTF